MTDLRVLIRQLQGALGGRRLKMGSTTLTWTLSQVSGAATITHGLGEQPALVVATVMAVGSGQNAFVQYGNVTATTFQLTGWSPGVFSGTLGVSWVAAV